ncbi:hypothetical protein EVAR_102112_1 [Eumeta japonica]|uniref:Uncharacterized protein n=1 Tax=Eumeta variegata TaxID=151549 RepID=A0A4C1U0I6_EUMVA|nr:hypothetical protein EVAR_102112_1 [Eumeta japonica]
MIVKAGYGRKKNKSRINAVEMRSLCSMFGVPQKGRCRNSDVRERRGLKEDLVTRVEKASGKTLKGAERALGAAGGAFPVSLCNLTFGAGKARRL